MRKKYNYFAFACFWSFFVCAPAIGVPPVLNEEYLIIDSKAESAEGKVKVLEFFSYACVHCFEFDPLLKRWVDDKRDTIDFSYVPAVFSTRMVPLAKLYYALEEMGKIGDLHGLVYYEIHVKKRKIFTDKAILDWIAEQDGISQEDFAKRFNSFTVGNKARFANKLARELRIPGTPYLVVGNKFLTGPSMVVGSSKNKAEGYDSTRLFDVVDQLVKMSRSQ